MLGSGEKQSSFLTAWGNRGGGGGAPGGGQQQPQQPRGGGSVIRGGQLNQNPATAIVSRGRGSGSPPGSPGQAPMRGGRGGRGGDFHYGGGRGGRGGRSAGNSPQRGPRGGGMMPFGNDNTANSLPPAMMQQAGGGWGDASANNMNNNRGRGRGVGGGEQGRGRGGGSNRGGAFGGNNNNNNVVPNTPFGANIRGGRGAAASTGRGRGGRPDAGTPFQPVKNTNMQPPTNDATAPMVDLPSKPAAAANAVPILGSSGAMENNTQAKAADVEGQASEQPQRKSSFGGGGAAAGASAFAAGGSTNTGSMMAQTSTSGGSGGSVFGAPKKPVAAGGSDAKPAAAAGAPPQRPSGVSAFGKSPTAAGAPSAFGVKKMPTQQPPPAGAAQRSSPAKKADANVGILGGGGKAPVPPKQQQSQNQAPQANKPFGGSNFAKSTIGGDNNKPILASTEGSSTPLMAIPKVQPATNSQQSGSGGQPPSRSSSAFAPKSFMPPPPSGSNTTKRPPPQQPQQQQQQQQQQHAPKPSISLTVQANGPIKTKVAAAFKVFVDALLKMHYAQNNNVQLVANANEALRAVCFDSEARTDDDSLRQAVDEMDAVFSASLRQHASGGAPSDAEVAGRSWIPVFALCSNANSLEYQVAVMKDGNWHNILKASCERMNVAVKCLAEMRQEGNPLAIPAMLEVVLRRHRTTFDRAGALQMNDVNSNAGSQCMHIYRNMPKQYRELVPTDVSKYNAQQRDACVAIAYLMIELLGSSLADTVTKGAALKNFVINFPRFFTHEIGACVAMHYRLAMLYIRNDALAEAQKEIAAAYAICPDGHVAADVEERLEKGGGLHFTEDELHAHNKELLFITLAALGLANGQLPSDDLSLKHDVLELNDFYFAVKAANLNLYNAALQEHSAFFLERGILSVMHLVRTQVLLGMLVKYFTEHENNKIISIAEYGNYYSDQFEREADVKYAYILPLLHTWMVQGGVSGNYLVLASRPFPPFPDLTSTTIVPQ